MPGLDITRQRNKFSKLLLLLVFVGCLGRISCIRAQAQETATQEQKPPAAEPPASESQDNQKSPDSSQSGVFVFRKDVDEVMLHATVVDDKQRIITNLDRTAFTILEDGKPQSIISFHHVDIPVAMGIVIDNSGSMREKRSKVNQAALNLVRS